MQSWTKDDIREAKANGINYDLFYQRVYFRDWTVERAKTEPPIKNRSLYHQYKELCEKHGISQGLFQDRICRGKDPIVAATSPKIQGKPRVIPLEILELAEKNGVTYSALKQRINKLKLSFEEAATIPLQTDFNRKRINKKKRDRRPIIGFNTTKWRENV